PFLVSLAFILLFGRNGVVTRGLGLDWSIYGFTGIVASQVFTFLPQAYILLANVLGNIDASLEEAAENLGAGPLTTLRRVTLALFITLIYGLIPLGSLVRLWGSDWSLSLGHYAFASSAEGAAPIWNSVELALVAGVVGTCVALVTAYVVERKRPPGRRVIEALSLLPAALPGTVVGLGYILAFNAPPLPLTGTLSTLVASVVFWKLPVAALAGINALQQIDPAIEEAAVSL